MHYKPSAKLVSWYILNMRICLYIGLISHLLTFTQGHASAFTQGHASAFTKGHAKAFTKGHAKAFTQLYS
jgi:hypothetical protein